MLSRPAKRSLENLKFAARYYACTFLGCGAFSGEDLNTTSMKWKMDDALEELKRATISWFVADEEEQKG